MVELGVYLVVKIHFYVILSCLNCQIMINSHFCFKNFINWRVVGTLVLICFLHINGSAQFNIVKETRIPLPSVDNYRTYQDKKGVIWICSENGLTRYNFNHSKTFRIADGLPTNDIWNLYSDNNERLWLYHKDNGIHYIQNDSVYTIKGSESLRETFVVADLNDTIYFTTFGYFNPDNIGQSYFYSKDGTFGKCSIYISKEVTVFNKQWRLQIDNVGSRLFFDEDNIPHAVYRSFTYGNVTTNEPIQILFNKHFAKNEVTFVTEKGENKLETSKNEKIIAFGNSKQLILEKNGKLQFYTDCELGIRDVAVERILNPFYNQFGTDFHFLLDIEDNIWITAYRGGVYFIPESFRHIFAFGKINKRTSALERNYFNLSTQNNNLYLFSRNSSIKEVNLVTGKESVLGSAHGLRDIKMFENYIAWSNNNGVYVHNSRTGNTSEINLNQRVVSFDFLDSATIYTNTGHHIDLIKNEVKTQDFLNGEISHIVFSSERVFTYQNNHIYIRNRENAECEQICMRNITKLARISPFNIAAYVDNNGIILFDHLGKTIGHFFKGYAIREVLFFEEHLIVISDSDVFFMSLKSISEIDENKFKVYNTFLNRANLSLQCATIIGDKLIVGLNDGVYAYLLTNVLKREIFKPRFDFVGLSVNNVLLREEGASFSYGDRDFTFRFNLYAYSNFGEVLLRYKLQGYDNEWQSNVSNKISYNTLPPGDYKLSAFAEVNGVKSAPIQYAFSISKPYWQTVPFIVLIAVLFVLMTLKTFQLIFSYRAKVYQRKNLLLELEFKALKAQLNPHFVFNSLNSLQTVMHRKSEIEANKYIVSFSKLMRTLLDNSRVLSISLKEELLFLENYVFLSEQKINDAIEFKVDYGNVKNPEAIHIRNMVLQPFVENSVIHGLASKEGSKSILIELEQKENILIVAIQDNGVGREAAVFNKLQRNDNFKSVSTTILKEKSRLLQEMHAEELNFRIEDLYEDINPAGTRVIVRMKIFHQNK